MANEKNLLKGKATEFRSGEEAARNGKKGGKASGEARRKRKAMKSVLNELLTMPAESDEAKTALAGVEHLLPECDNQTAVLAGLMKQAMLGEVKAVQEIRNILGESRDTAAEKAERKARTEKLKADTAALRARTGEPEEAPDDGFLEAMGKAAAEVWQE